MTLPLTFLPVQTYRTGEGGEAVDGKLKPKADAPAADVPGAKTLGSDAAAAGAEQPGAEGAAGNGSGDGKGARSTFSFDRPGQAKGRVSEVAAAKAKEPEAPAVSAYGWPCVLCNLTAQRREARACRMALVRNQSLLVVTFGTSSRPCGPWISPYRSTA